MTEYTLLQGDCLERMKEIPDGSVDVVLSSPPYNIGKEYESRRPLEEYTAWQTHVLQEAVRTLRRGGNLCWQVGNYVDKGRVYPLDCLLFQPLLDLGLTPRNRIIWHFGHGLHCRNRFSGRHETVLWFSKGEGYYFDLDSVRVPSKYPGKRHYKGPKKGQLSGNPLGKNPSDVWEIGNVKYNHPEKTAHPCQFPLALAERLVLALCVKGGTVLDPFMGSGTTGVAALRAGRSFLGVELDKGYFDIAQQRIGEVVPVVYDSSDIAEVAADGH